MKVGYIIWSMGWVCIALGLALIVLGIVEGMWFGIVRGLMVMGVSLIWFKWGSGRIQGAVLKQNEKEG